MMKWPEVLKAGSHVRCKHKHKKKYICEPGQHKHKHKNKELFPSSCAWACACFVMSYVRTGYHKHKHKRNGSIFLSEDKQMYSVRLRRNTVPAYVLVLMLVSLVWTSFVLMLALMLVRYMWTGLNYPSHSGVQNNSLSVMQAFLKVNTTDHWSSNDQAVILLSISFCSKPSRHVLLLLYSNSHHST